MLAFIPLTNKGKLTLNKKFLQIVGLINRIFEKINC